MRESVIFSGACRNPVQHVISAASPWVSWAVEWPCADTGATARRRRCCSRRWKLRCKSWLTSITTDFADSILPFCSNSARIWGHLCAPDNTNVVDKQIAATALAYDLTLVTRNVRHVAGTGVRVLEV